MTLEINELSVNINVRSEQRDRPEIQAHRQHDHHADTVRGITDEVVRRCVAEVMLQLDRRHTR